MDIQDAYQCTGLISLEVAGTRRQEIGIKEKGREGKMASDKEREREKHTEGERERTIERKR